MGAPGDRSLLDLINEAQRGGPPAFLSALAVAALQRGEFPSLERGSWVVTDGSGADPALEIAQTIEARYYRIGQLVVFWADIVYPVTLDEEPAVLTGLPDFAASGYPIEVGSVFSSISLQDIGQPVTMYWDGPLAYFYDVDGAALSNLDLSGKTITFAGLGVLAEYGVE